MEPLHQLRQSISSVIAGLSDEQTRWHPPGKWCAGEVLEHLYLSYTGTIKGCARVLATGKPLISPPTWRQRVRKAVIIGLGYMPSGRESPAVARPRGLPPAKVLAEILPKIAEMDEILSLCEQKLGRGDLLDHPIVGPLTTRQWKKLHLVHGLHHVKQIQRLQEMSREQKAPDRSGA
jgi:hypothetical protein